MLYEGNTGLMVACASSVPMSTLQQKFQDIMDILKNRLAIVEPVPSQSDQCIPHLAQIKSLPFIPIMH